MDMEFFECACGYVCSEDLTNLSWWCIHVVVVLYTCSACCTGVCVHRYTCTTFMYTPSTGLGST